MVDPSSQADINITETRPLKNIDRENANKWKMT